MELGKPWGGLIWDCLIQEIILSTGELIFQWRAAEHYKLSDTFREIGSDGGIGRAFDFFHINSVAKDPKGNYLISSRYMHTITYISGSTGEIIWILGGKGNMFKDLSDGRATNFAYQHDARWSDDYSTITMFDNGVDDNHRDIAYTRGLRIKIDQEDMTAELVTKYMNPQHLRSLSQGSFQTLPNGNVFMGYGNSAAMTEYSYNGTVLCDAHFGPQSRFGSGDVQSYRAYKYEWHGFPTTDPDVTVLMDDEDTWTFYVSWNGATDVTNWILQGAAASEAEDDQWQDLDELEKVGFETGFKLTISYPQYLRILALNINGTILGQSNPLDVTEEKAGTLLSKHRRVRLTTSRSGVFLHSA
jgi:hypothetical protein